MKKGLWGVSHSSGRNSLLLNVVWDVKPRTCTAILLLPKDKTGPERRAKTE